jgi:GNAT superfamily N-acetyltransferase
MHSFAAPQVVCRPALPSDTEDVLEFTKFIWEGHDYIQYVWHDWLADPNGLLAAAVYGPHTVGIGKVTLLSPGQWWLEGLRVDPKVQGLKIGSHLHEYLDRWWREHGDGTLRLMTSSERVQVHHLSERTGYRKVGEVWSYRSPAAVLTRPEATELSEPESRASRPSPAGPRHAFELVTLDDIAAAVKFTSGHLAGSHNLLDLGWRFTAPDEATLATLVHAQRLYWWDGRSGLAGFWEDDDEAGRVLAISFVACEASRLIDLLADVPRLAAQNGYVSALWLAPHDRALESALLSAGFSSEWDHSGFLYEKALHTT